MTDPQVEAARAIVEAAEHGRIRRVDPWDRAKTPALAICAASLRALASMEADNA